MKVLDEGVVSSNYLIRDMYRTSNNPLYTKISFQFNRMRKLDKTYSSKLSQHMSIWDEQVKSKSH